MRKRQALGLLFLAGCVVLARRAFARPRPPTPAPRPTPTPRPRPTPRPAPAPRAPAPPPPARITPRAAAPKPKPKAPARAPNVVVRAPQPAPPTNSYRYAGKTYTDKGKFREWLRQRYGVAHASGGLTAMAAAIRADGETPRTLQAALTWAWPAGSTSTLHEHNRELLRTQQMAALGILRLE